MKSSKLNPFLRTIGYAGLAMTIAPLAAQGPVGSDRQQALERQIEQFSRMLPEDPAAREQFNKGLEEMKKAFEDDAANRSRDDQPRNYEFRWEGNSENLGDLRMEFERMGGLFGEGLFDRFFGGDALPPGNGPLQGQPRAFHMQNWPNFSVAEPPENSKNHIAELRKFQPVVAAARRSSIQLLSGGNQIALGTIVTGNGYALTKRSELGARPRTFEARLADGKSVSARFVEAIADYDLALIKLDADGLTPATFTETALPIGSFLAAADVTEEPAAVGILSVLARNLSAKTKGYLGIGIRSAEGQVAVASVAPDSAAAAAGLRPDDVITEVDGQRVSSPPQLINAVSGREPDAIVEISYVRNGRASKTSAKLRSRADLEQYGLPLDRSAYDLTSRMGANLSDQRSGYPSALQHDLPLNSNHMGGPLVDLEGNIIGINIARAGRVSTYALPAAEVNEILEALNLANRNAIPADPEQLPPVETADTNALREEVERAERAIEDARNALRAAEESARSARQAFEQKR